MSKPSLAVLITYHDEGELLRECIESFLDQEAPPDEMLIHDDASARPAEQFLPKRFPGSVIRSPKNIGPARSRNLLWRQARSEFVHFQDSDDVVLPGWNTRVRGAITNDVDVVFTEIQSRRDGAVASAHVLNLERLANGTDLIQFCLQGSMLVPSGSYRRALVEAIGGYREILWQAEDFDFHTRLAAHLRAAGGNLRYRTILEPLVEIRLRPESRSQDLRRVWLDSIRSLELLFTELPSECAGDLSDAAARVGAQLYRLGAEPEARHAFELAAQWGSPTFAGENPLYRRLARHWGPERAEALGKVYREFAPERWRSALRRWLGRSAT